MTQLRIKEPIGNSSFEALLLKSRENLDPDGLGPDKTNYSHRVLTSKVLEPGNETGFPVSPLVRLEK
jgi:hypothetical protein